MSKKGAKQGDEVDPGLVILSHYLSNTSCMTS